MENITECMNAPNEICEQLQIGCAGHNIHIHICKKNLIKFVFLFWQVIVSILFAALFFSSVVIWQFTLILLMGEKVHKSNEMRCKPAKIIIPNKSISTASDKLPIFHFISIIDRNRLQWFLIAPRIATYNSATLLLLHQLAIHWLCSYYVKFRMIQNKNHHFIWFVFIVEFLLPY